MVEVRWLLDVSVVETLGTKSQPLRMQMGILSKYYPTDGRQEYAPWSLSDFYDSVYVPPSDTSISPRLQQTLSETTLYPFQQRAVDWLLRREGVTYPADGEQPLIASESPLSPPVSFQPVQDANGRNVYISHLRGLIVSDFNALNDSSRALRGGILAEEMGLGKTVELISLMCHNKRTLPQGDILDAYTGAIVKPSGATLIITPPSILEQWKNEIRTHAPELKVTHYEGVPAHSAPKAKHAEATTDNLMQYDVVLTTYDVLKREVHFATPPPDRSLRHKSKHERSKSPLVEISWWRVCLDEAQMVESGVSNAARVARIIPRCNAWAVSGTPLRKDIQDLRGLLMFLRYEPFAGCKAAWERLRLDKASFRAIFNQITLRHTKDKIREELRLPPQKRVVITVPFTAIEEQNYSEMIRQMCDECGLSPEGHLNMEDQDPSDPVILEKMRAWLVRLRQTCLHANVGMRNRKALGAKNGPIRTLHDFLEIMIDRTDTSLKAEARNVIDAQIRQGHIIGNAMDHEDRNMRARTFYLKALEEAQGFVKACRHELVQENEKLDTLRLEDNHDLDDEAKESQNLGRIPVIRMALRSFLELEHVCTFFIANSYFLTKDNAACTKPESEEFYALEKQEEHWFAKAKEIRAEVLRDSQTRAQRQMDVLKRRTLWQLSPIADLSDMGGLEGKKILDMMDDVCDVLNAQALQLDKWRQRIVDILQQPLVDADQGEKTTGEEYEDSTKAQDELYIYIMAFRTLVADMSAAVNGQENLLTKYELETAEKQANDPDPEKRGHAPELVLEVAKIRRRLKPTEEIGSIKAVIAMVRSLLTSLEWKAGGRDERAAAESAIVQKQFAKIQAIAREQSKALTELEKEQDLFRATMNQRLEFYRQLQQISDTVTPYKEDLDPTFDANANRIQQEREVKAKRALAGHKTKLNYLINLRTDNQQSDVSHSCIICQEEFEIGVLTTCGHKVSC